jgi:AcrR family transcriptional regulator
MHRKVAAMPDTVRRKPRKIPLSAERIAAEALAMVDRDGMDALSFRALAKRLGCEAMSLYHYFPSKAHLIDAMVNLCLAEIDVADPGLDRAAQIRAFCLSYRQVALHHPGFVPVLLTHRLNHREGLTMLEKIARLLDVPGVPSERQAQLFRVLSHYMMGAALDEALGFARGPSATEPVPPDVARAEFPGIMALGRHFGADNHLALFLTGLDLIIGWIDAELSAAAANRPRTVAG